MKEISRISVMILAALTLLAFSMPAQASATTDARIVSAAEESYVFKTYLKDDDIKVTSKDGVVTLTGTVADNNGKTLAQETAAGLPGVKSVRNNLKVAGESVSETSDTWLMTKVKATLLYHRNVSGFNTEVNVQDGIVTLKGEAPSRAHKDLTTEYAQSVEGVKRVSNEMTVAKSDDKARGTADKAKATAGEKIDDVVEYIDDASVTALVKTTLLYNRSTSGLNTKVETNDGVVTLSGKASNNAEVDLASRITRDVKGVESVRNQMTVE